MSQPLPAICLRIQPYFGWAAAFSLVVNMLMLVPALFMLQVFDRVLTSRSIETLIMLLVVSLGALLFMAYLDVIRARLLNAASLALERLLGPPILSEMVRRQAAGGSAEGHHGLRDVSMLRAALSGPGVIALFDAPWMPVYVLIIFFFHPFLGVIALAGALILLALALLNEKLSREPLENMQLAMRRAGRFADQSVAHAGVAHTLGMTDNLARGWEHLNRSAMENQVRASRAATAVTSASRFMRQAVQVAMLAAGVWLVIDQHTTPGVMIAATILLGRALAPVESAIGSWKSLVDARGAYRRLHGLLASAPKSESVTELTPPEGALSIERVVFGFRGHERPVIRGASFAVDAGTALAIVGPSASGKSTLARLIVGVWKPVTGTVRLDGADIAAWPRDRIGQYIGYLPQEVELFAGTVSQNIARMGEVDSAAVIEAARHANAHDFILRLPQGYDTQIGDGGAFLSGGQRQRVALARALYGNPRLVVLDEPNSGLDSEGEEALARAIRRMKAERVTLVIITHRMNLLSLVDRILVLREGVIEKMAAPSDVLAPARPKGGYPPVVAGHIQPKT